MCLRIKSKDVLYMSTSGKEQAWGEGPGKKKGSEAWCHEAKKKECFLEKVFNCEVEKLRNVSIGHLPH